MKTLSPVALSVLGAFALLTTGCATEYRTVSTVPTYSGTTLPAASRVALVMEFRGGEPTPQERAEVRALLADNLSTPCSSGAIPRTRRSGPSSTRTPRTA